MILKKGPIEQDLLVESLDKSGNGVGFLAEKKVLIRNALAGELATARILKRKRGIRFADGIRIQNPAAIRRDSSCKSFPRCGGCGLHHMTTSFQMEFKKKLLADALKSFGVSPHHWMESVASGCLGYRRKARLGVRYVGSEVLVGFRESFSNRVARVEECLTLDPRASKLIKPLKLLIAEVSIPNQIPQIEVACGDEEVSLIVRHLADWSSEDLVRWAEFSDTFNIEVLFQSKGYDSLVRLTDEKISRLKYKLIEYGLSFEFYPQQFTQVNALLNQDLVRSALALMGDLRNQVVVDLFCGIGNFSLPIARSGGKVIGLEMEQSSVEMARSNARLNGLEDFARFEVADLYDQGGQNATGHAQLAEVMQENPTSILLDPPRSGAGPHLASICKKESIERIVYVSCNPETFASDGAILIESGFRLERVGVFDMFPNTSHLETLGLFVKECFESAREKQKKITELDMISGGR